MIEAAGEASVELNSVGIAVARPCHAELRPRSINNFSEVSRIGRPNYVFSGPELHHFHHSKDMAESNTNFGSNLILWDLVFGTFYLPKDHRPGTDVGMTELTLRDNFWHHLAVPFMYRRLTEPPAAPRSPAAAGTPAMAAAPPASSPATDPGARR